MRRRARSNLLANTLDSVILEYFKHNPNPSDPDIHALASELSLTSEHVERHIYRLFTQCLRNQTQALAKLELAYTSVPLNAMPDMALVETLAACNKKLGYVIRAVVDGSSKNLFELHNGDVQELANHLKMMGWSCKLRNENVMACTKAGKLMTIAVIGG